jgi:hypothetical protein
MTDRLIFGAKSRSKHRNDKIDKFAHPLIARVRPTTINNILFDNQWHKNRV